MHKPSEARPANGLILYLSYLSMCLHTPCMCSSSVPPYRYNFNSPYLSYLYHVCVTAVVMDKYMLDREDVVEQQMTKEEHEIKMANMAMLRINQLLPGDYDESYGVKR